MSMGENMHEMRTKEATKHYLVFLELRCFSSVLPSMPKGEIVSMNGDAIIMRKYCRTLI